MLSKAVRNILIQSVVATVPYYSMQTSLLPAATIASLERLNRAFFWGEFDGECKMHAVAWPSICRSKSMGGTGIKRLRQMNLALLAELLWRLILEEDVLWVNVLKAKYGPPLRASPPRQSTTHMWRSILAAAPVVLAGLMSAAQREENRGAITTEVTWRGRPAATFSARSTSELQVPEDEGDERRKWQKVCLGGLIAT